MLNHFSFLYRVRSKFAMASCFDFRMRTHSLDLHTLSSGTRLAKLSKLFRSRSDGNMKGYPGSSPSVSPGTSPKSSPAQPPRRRLMRVVRDGQRKGVEYENPHVIRKYTQEYVERQYLTKSVSLEDGTNQLPYTVTGHTILKKHSSLDDSESSPPPLHKHASFREEVEIIEFDKKGRQKIEKGRYTRRERLHDSDSEYDSLSECGPIEESEEEGEDKENELPLDKSDAAKSQCKGVGEEKETIVKCENLVVEDIEDSPPSSPTSDPDKLIPTKKTKMTADDTSQIDSTVDTDKDVPDDIQIHPKEAPRIESPPELKSES